MPTFKIHHITSYEYSRPVIESVNEIRIFPFNCEDQEVLSHELTITGDPEVHLFSDYWGNKTGIFNILAPHSGLSIESRLIVRTLQGNDKHLNFNTGFETLELEVNNNLQLLELTKADQITNQQAITEILQQIYQPWKSVAATVQDCSRFIYHHFNYIKGITDVETTVDEIIAHRSGVCQDFAHVMLQVLRSLKIPSRYVSGYICPNKNGLRGEGATHAWVETWIPGFGWAGIDPTNNIWATNNHVKLAVGRNFTDCSPVKGTFKGSSEQSLYVYVAVGYEDGHKFEEKNQVFHPINTSYSQATISPDEISHQQ
ncbi:transglutaminase family protein [Flavihumibacter rivuli]|uniref:transglutaminase family protein n=1 Tax=Flavihumibacter rivuli TaxID=2838156 RepID=UPI001BDE4E56|nr:transglutaminase family protein [Flavihumibacter rivuli]ULQ56606.1 transglutaminase family protein [Flavihumibacter rivuli]